MQTVPLHKQSPRGNPGGNLAQVPGHLDAARGAKPPKPADPVSAIPAAAPPPPRPVPLRTQVVSALVLFVPSTGCYNYFILTSDGAWLPAIPLYPLPPGLPTGTTAC